MTLSPRTPYEIRMATLDRGEALDEVVVRAPGMVHFDLDLDRVTARTIWAVKAEVYMQAAAAIRAIEIT